MSMIEYDATAEEYRAFLCSEGSDLFLGVIAFITGTQIMGIFPCIGPLCKGSAHTVTSLLNLPFLVGSLGGLALKHLTGYCQGNP